MKNTRDFFVNHKASSDVIDFASKFKTLSEVWNACHRADWMIWILKKAKKDDGLERELRIFTCDCADSFNDIPKSCVYAISIARQYADGLVSPKELQKANADAILAISKATSQYSARMAESVYAATSFNASYAAAPYPDSDVDEMKKKAELLRSLVKNPFE